MKTIVMRILISLLLAMGFIAGYSVTLVPRGHAQDLEPSSGPTLTATLRANPSTPANPATPTISITSTSTPPPPVITPTANISATTMGLEILDEVSFGQLGFTEETLRGPFDSLNFRFNLPADWELTGSAELKLRIKTYSASVGVKPSLNLTETLLGALDISLNGVMLRTVSLDEREERTVTVPITTTALLPTRLDGRHDLKISLDSGLSCDYNVQTRLVVLPTSSFILPHQVTPPPTDLTLLPRPIYQGSFLSDTAVIVIPNQPSTSELQAALAVAAGFGQMTDGALAISLKPFNRLTPEIRANNHLIFIGKPASFSLLKDIQLPAPVSGAGLKIAEVTPEDGIIQMAVSPWNKSKVVLVVSGASDAAIKKAGQAVSSGLIGTNTQPDLAIVAKVQPDELISDSSTPDRTFSRLGYAVETLRDRGVSSVEYHFDVPPGHIPGDEVYLDLVFNHSALLDYERSTLAVRLNDETVGNVRLSDESTSLTTARLTIPRTVIRSGDNRLEIRTDLAGLTTCVDPNSADLWLTIWPESSMHLPLREAEGVLKQVFDLSEYPLMFTRDVSLGSTAFVLSLKDPTAWDVAARIAFDLGNRANMPLAEFIVVTDERIPEEIRQTHHLLIIGRPSKLPIIAELGDALPAPFQAGSDIATERNMRVVYRISRNSHLGYLELLPAPWQPSLSVLAVLGSSDEGLASAGTLLTEREPGRNIQGNFLIINNEQIVIGDRVINIYGQDSEVVAATEEETTAQLASSNEQPIPNIEGEVQEPKGLEPVGAAPLEDSLFSQLTAPPTDRPAWLLPLFGLSTALIVVTLVILLISSWRRHRSV